MQYFLKSINILNKIYIILTYIIIRGNINLIKYSKIKILVAIFLLILSNLSIFTIQAQEISKARKSTNIQTTNVSYDLLIISPGEFSENLIPLVEHKDKHQVKTKLVTTEEVYQQIFWEGKDKAEKVKLFIKTAIEKWNIQYVLLVGGRKNQRQEESWWVPIRYSYINRPYIYEDGGILPQGNFLTDLYFADIYDSEGNFSSWDDNDNGIFGEWGLNKSASDIPDLIPDVYVGRLPCRNKLDVFLIVRKIIRYETGKFDDSWFKKMAVVAGDTYPIKTDYVDGENYTQQALDFMSDFEPVKVWASIGNLHWIHIVRVFNKGCGFIFFSTHGCPKSVSTHPPDDEDWIGEFGLKHMLFLRNRKRLPVCIAGSGCFVNLFNVSLGYSHFTFPPITKCWGWSLVKKPFGGCISVIGSTALSYESPDIDNIRGGCEWLDVHFFEQYQKNKNYTLGQCWGNTIKSFFQNFTINWNDTSISGDALIAKNGQQWLLIGDPSLKIGGYN